MRRGKVSRRLTLTLPGAREKRVFTLGQCGVSLRDDASRNAAVIDSELCRRKFARMSSRRLHPPTWKHAIETVLYTLVCVARSEPPISDEQDRILTDVYLLCDDLRTRRHRHTDKTNTELAEKYAISPRTVRNWRKAGCPFAKGQASSGIGRSVITRAITAFSCIVFV